MSDAALLAAAARLLGDEPADGELSTAALVLQRCEGCGAVRYPAAPRCPECLAAGFEWVPVEGGGTIWSACTYHRAYDPAFADAVPYNVVLVELDAGPRLI